ncbi:4-hydroxy-tetrahydrodipicolinate synthase [Pontivivens insulae]|uniref:4-hydroxy-tetrahydrodipicolinate synthase n=1 Tax=Pontivivens insulae TaxID=1639689 RepID=A0A2R8AEX4_9RHOB|nr:4-hydroxy-tetrahydrodipicolinate synthase [Pontivivens insulae]RED12047.1 dihydrodipicolinate synthase [Pontivivens insulae]SPF30803.1 4-hydroxy-tetrahydrodipicolinate synthase [Pontivivens insulae]
MFKGSIPALITPFSGGEVDEKKLRELVDWQIAEGSHGLLAVGTGGESPTLSAEEHMRVVQIVVEQTAGRVPVIAGAGSNNTTEAIEFAQHAGEVGADALLIVTPYYNKPNQAGLIAHYTAIHDASTLPIILYNIPGRSIIDMGLETMAEIAKLERVVGVKDATGEVDRITDQRMAIGPDFIQLSGNDETALAVNAHGGQGCITTVGNIAPRLSAQMQEACLAGDFATARELNEKLFPLIRAAFCEPSPAPAKYALSLLGRCEPDVRLPLIEMSDVGKAQMRAAMIHAGLLDG